MPEAIPGLHHVTAIAGDPQRNVDFYSGVLSLRLVKKTVNFDDPNAYHLYYGDHEGSPGTIVTFFAWPGGERGRAGVGQFSTFALAIPPRSFGFWIERLVARGIPHDHPVKRFGDHVVAFRDPDGLVVELVGSGDAGPVPGAATGDIPAEHAIRRIHGVTLLGNGTAESGDFFVRKLGFRWDRTEGTRSRFSIGQGESIAHLDLVDASGFWEGAIQVGTIHHVAWRTTSDEQQREWQEALRGQDISVTDLRDRQYFHSIYFDEPGGAHQEIATDQPGFATDESVESLGSQLRLPPWLEPMRESLERTLPPISLPASGSQHVSGVRED
jgi:catechol 2,3-dioxygenase-like lactoylglutathione lyase family enzyme